MCGKVLYLTQNDLARNSGFATVILDYNIHRGVKSLPPFPPFPTHMHSHTHRHKTHTHTDRHKTHTHTCSKVFCPFAGSATHGRPVCKNCSQSTGASAMQAFLDLANVLLYLGPLECV
jgi:hypothetical protein